MCTRHYKGFRSHIMFAKIIFSTLLFYLYMLEAIYAKADQITLCNAQNNSDPKCKLYTYRTAPLSISGPKDLIDQSTNNSLEILNLGASSAIQANYAEGYVNTSTTDLSVNSITLDFSYIVSPLLGFYGSTYLNTSAPFNSSPIVPSYVNALANSGIYLYEAYMAIGNLNTSPYYAYVGQTALPYATTYSPTNITTDFVSTMQSITTRAVGLGYQSSGDILSFNPELFVFYSNTTDLSRLHTTTTGINILTNITLSPSSSIAIASGLLTNIADSDGFQITSTSPAHRHERDLFNYSQLQGKSAQLLAAETAIGLDIYDYDAVFAGFAMSNNYEQIQHKVAGASLALQINTSTNTSISASYATALKPFSYLDLSFTSTGAFSTETDPTENFGAQPSSGNIYIMQSFNNDFSIYMGYEESFQALALAIPKNRILVGVSKNINPFTQLILEVRRESNYGENCFAYGHYFTSNNGSYQYSLIPTAYALGKKSTDISMELNIAF